MFPINLKVSPFIIIGWCYYMIKCGHVIWALSIRILTYYVKVKQLENLIRTFQPIKMYQVMNLFDISILKLQSISKPKSPKDQKYTQPIMFIYSMDFLERTTEYYHYIEVIAIPIEISKYQMKGPSFKKWLKNRSVPKPC